MYFSDITIRDLGKEVSKLANDLLDTLSFQRSHIAELTKDIDDQRSHIAELKKDIDDLDKETKVEIEEVRYETKEERT